MKDVHTAVLMHALRPQELLALERKTPYETRNTSHLKPYGHTIRQALRTQTPWTRDQEARWNTRLIMYNPQEAPVLCRMPVAMMLSQYARLPHIVEGSPASVEMFARMAPAGGDPRRAAQIRACAPDILTPETIARGMEKAARLLTDPLDQRMRADLATIATATRKCPEVERVPSQLTGAAQEVKPVVLIDHRGKGLSKEEIRVLIGRIQAGGISDIAVVADDQKKAKGAATHLRRNGDCMKALLHPMDPELWKKHRAICEDKQAKGLLWPIGAGLNMGAARQREPTRFPD